MNTITQTMCRRVTVIPATVNFFRNTQNQLKNIRRKVAAYARVSTDSEEQLTSYEAQVDHYTRYIKSRNDWEFVEVYTDEGISATNMRQRDGFNRMVQDALDGKIDLIITKSVSRFARNTVDSLITVRKLKEKGIEVYFEKENIYTLDSKGELLITIMSSLAQEESRSISENVTWGQRKRFADGKISLPYKRFLGYEKGDDGLPKVIEKEAKTVRLIYRLFLEGKTINSISTYLKKNKILSPGGKKTWSQSTVRSILTNEKYKGDALLQKQYTVDFLTKKRKKNNGEIPQYYVKNSHEAIIDPVVFDLVQSEMKIREKSPRRRSSVNPFSSKIQCGNCGSFYGSKVWHSNDKYRKTIWQCNKKFKNQEKCKTPHIDENRIKQEFIRAFNDLIKNKNEVIDDCKMTILKLTNTRSIDEKINKLNTESVALIELTKALVNKNSKTAMDQDEYNEKYETYLKGYEAIKSKLLEAEEIKQNLKARIEKIEYFIKNLESNNEKIFEFDEHLWYTMVEKVIVNEDGSLEFKFKNSVQ